MELYLANCIAGFIVLDENLEIFDCKLFEKEEAASKIIKMEHREVLCEEKELIESVPENCDCIHVESNKTMSKYKEFKNSDKIQLEVPNKGGNHLRKNLNEILLELNFSSQENLKSDITKIYREIAILQMKESSQEEDKLLIQSINSIDDIDESISKLVERIRELYVIYFPEMDTIQNNETYINLIANVGDREELIKHYLKDFKIDLEFSNGANIEKEDLELIMEFAKSVQSLQRSRKNIENYIAAKMDRIAPNLKNLVGSSLGAKLISHAGSIKKLATYPSGTVQIMGAEKALFRHLKTGENPPKHGLIFQHPEVRTSPWWVRGKIARTLSLKISLSVRKDVFSKELDPKIAEDFLEKVKEIKKDNPFPKKTSKRRQEERSKKSKFSDRGTHRKKMKKTKRRKKGKKRKK